MNVVGPCLSPVSYAVQQFHRPKNGRHIHKESVNAGTIVNPMVARRIVYSPPLARRLKRSRLHFESDKLSSDDMITEEKHTNEVADVPQRKKQKITQSIPPIAVGKKVYIRFGSNDTDIKLIGSVILTENFGTLVLIKEANPNLSGVPAYSKHWTRWRGEVDSEDNTTPVLDAIHRAE